MTLELNGLSADLLYEGAAQAAAGKTLGLSVEETFNLQLELKKRGIKQVAPDNNAPDPFGEAPEPVFKKPGKGGKLADVKEVRRPQDDFRPAAFGGANEVVRGELVRNDVLPEEFLNSEEVAQQREGRDRQKIQAGDLRADRGLIVNPGAAAGAGPRDAQNRLLDALDQFGPEAFGSAGPEMVRIEERLNDVNNPGPVGIARGRQQAAGMLEADRRAFNTEELNQRISQELNNRFGIVQPPLYYKDDDIGGELGEPRRPNRNNEIVRRDGKRVNLDFLQRQFNQDGFSAIRPAFNRFVDDVIAEEQSIRNRLEGKGGINPIAEMRNDNAAARDARIVAAKNAGIGRQLADANIGHIAEIRGLGKAGMGPRGIMMQKVIDPNEPTSAQALNAPAQGPLPRGQAWMIGNLPPAIEGGARDGEFPQVGVMEEGKLFADRLRGQGFNVPKQEIRNLQELEAAADFVIRKAQGAGQRLGRFDQEAKKMVFPDQPGIQEVLYKLGYSEGEIKRLANAMNQVEQAGLRDVNEVIKENFDARIPNRRGEGVQLITNVEGMRADGGVPLARIRNEKVGRGKEAKNVRGQLAKLGPEEVLRQLDEAGMLYTAAPEDITIKGKLVQRKGDKILLPEAARMIQEADLGRVDAQIPLIGAIKDEVPRAGFIRGDARGLDRAARVKKFGIENANKADRVEANFLAGEEQRRRRIEGQQQVQIRPGGFQNQFDVDFPEVSKTVVNVPSVKQPIQEARVAQSIAPDPWAGTGPARIEPAIQQPQQQQQLALPKARSPQQNDFKGQFARQMMNKTLGRRAGRERFRNNAMYGAAAAGSFGLGTLIGSERDARNEEEQYS